MSYNFERIPEELRALNQWIVWKYEETQGGKPTKVPYRIDGKGHADVTKPETWGTFYAAVNAYLSQRNADSGGKAQAYAGIGFVFSAKDKYCGIDLDHTQDAQALETQRRIFSQFDSYSERSVSGNGLHIIIEASLVCGRRRNSVEIYSSDRFFAMTGDVYHDAPVANRQDIADVLWAEMGKIKTVNGYQGTFEEKETDAQILYRASRALNGHKFADLLNGKWRDHYPSQSEADFAFVDMVAFYTQARQQIVRLFRQSDLGKRDKAQRPDYVEYMLNRAFDRMLPPVDIEGLSNALAEAIARRAAQAGLAGSPSGKATGFDPVSVGSSPTPVAIEPNPYDVPPGLLGDLAGFIYAAAPRPVPEIALAGAIALMAGIAGRAYNVNGMGLNHYLLLLARTGSGKEAIAAGIDKIVSSIANEVPAVRDFIGPGEIASSQALQKRLARTPCIFSVLGEFGLRMQQMAHPRANANELSLKRTLLDLYHKNGAGRLLGDMAYSNKDNNVEAIKSPSFTLLGESTQETFLRIVDDSLVQDGLLPRFLVIDYRGQRVALNERHTEAIFPEHIRTRFIDFVAHCLKMAHGVNGVPMFTNVQLDAQATLSVRQYDVNVDNKINGAPNETIRQIWNRAHVKVLRLAALIAVGVNPFQPTITDEHVTYARRIVNYDINNLLSRFANGEVGEETSEVKQMNKIRQMVLEYVTRSFTDLYAYNLNAAMHHDKVIPMAYLSRRLLNKPSFKDDKFGATNALKRTIATAIDCGYVREIGKTEMLEKYDSSARSFVITNFNWVSSRD